MPEDDGEIEIEGAGPLADLDGIPLPPAVKRSLWKAISQLITGVFDVPAAYLEGKAAEIRTESDGKNVVTMSAAKSAATAFGADKALTERAVEHFGARIVKEQANRESVAVEAANSLSEDPPQLDAEEEIDEDWLSLFSDLASKRSSSDLHKLFGKILAGEIRQPGSFSPASIHALSTLTGPAAQRFQKICDLSIQLPKGFPCVIYNFYPNFVSKGEPSLGINYHDLVTLQSAGLLSPTLGNGVELETWIGNVVLKYCDDSVKFSKLAPTDGSTPKKIPRLNIVLFSPVGHELRSVVPTNKNVIYHKKLTEWLTEHQVEMVLVDKEK